MIPEAKKLEFALDATEKGSFILRLRSLGKHALPAPGKVGTPSRLEEETLTPLFGFLSTLLCSLVIADFESLLPRLLTHRLQLCV